MLTRRVVLAVPAAAVLVAGGLFPNDSSGLAPPPPPPPRKARASVLAASPLAQGLSHWQDVIAAGGDPRPVERQLAQIPAVTTADAAAAAGYVASWCDAHCNDDCTRALAEAVATFLKNGGIA